MRLNAFPPAIIVRSSHPRVSTTRACIIAMSDGASPSTIYHELWHVRQFWFAMILGVALWMSVLNFLPVDQMPDLVQEWIVMLVFLPHLWFHYRPDGVLKKEAAAYAESVRRGRDLQNAVSALADNDHLYEGIDRHEAEWEIRQRLEPAWFGYRLF